jgi:phage/plasmid primase-like uncharacterized protein
MEFELYFDEIDGLPSPGLAAYARSLWRKSHLIEGTIAERYLRRRGIELSPLPPALRFTRLRSSEIGEAFEFSALIVGIQAPDGSFGGVQVRFLSEDGNGDAPFLQSPRKTFGTIAGGAVRVGQPESVLVIAEGIENAISVQQATAIPAWASLGASNLPCVVVPSQVRTIIIAADADAAGIRAAELAQARFLRQGRRCRIAVPRSANDFNEMII